MRRARAWQPPRNGLTRPLRVCAIQHEVNPAVTTNSEYSVKASPFPLFRALPDHAGETLERHQQLAGVGPFLQFLDRDVIERLAPGAAGKQRARDVHHVRRARAFVSKRRAAMRAEAARGFRGLVLEARDGGLAPGDAKTLAPASDIGRVGRAMRATARRRMIMPGPARGRVDLETDFSAQALTGGCSNCSRFLRHLHFPHLSSLRGATRRSNPDFLVARWI